MLALAVLAGWALWAGGIFDNDLQRAARSGSVYAADGVDLDTRKAAEIIGNRRLFVAFMEPGTDLGDACDEVDGPADGTLALFLSRADGDEDYDTYGCSQLPGAGDENFGEAFVAESVISRGIDSFIDSPIDAVKIITLNYDLLARTDTVPDDARSISPSLPKYLIALAAVIAVLGGSTFAYVTARRAGKLAAEAASQRHTELDAQSSVNARAALLAQQILDLDRAYGRPTWRKKHGAKYLALVGDYTSFTFELSRGSGRNSSARVDRLLERSRELARR